MPRFRVCLSVRNGVRVVKIVMSISDYMFLGFEWCVHTVDLWSPFDDHCVFSYSIPRLLSCHYRLRRARRKFSSVKAETRTRRLLCASWRHEVVFALLAQPKPSSAFHLFSNLVPWLHRTTTGPSSHTAISRSRGPRRALAIGLYVTYFKRVSILFGHCPRSCTT